MSIYDTAYFIDNAIKSNIKFQRQCSYTKTIYKNSKTKVIITCGKPNHGDFEQFPANHLAGHGGCSFCGKAGKQTAEIFFKKANNKFGTFFDYSESIYKNGSTKIIIIC